MYVRENKGGILTNYDINCGTNLLIDNLYNFNNFFYHRIGVSKGCNKEGGLDISKVKNNLP